MQVYVKVTNKNDFPITDSYDGIEYVMMPLPAKALSLPFHVAAHFFGLKTPEDIHDKSGVDRFMMKRWGWNRPEVGLERAKTLCDNITLDTAIYEMREVEQAEEVLMDPRVDHAEDEPEAIEHPKRMGRPPVKKDAA